jgi:hypothetical protein
LVILKQRDRYSYYDRDDTTRNCASRLHKLGEVIRGNKYGHICGLACPFRAKDISLRCKCQKVVFGVAYTPEEESYPCMAFIQGSTYMPFCDYYRKLTKQRGGKAGTKNLAPFCRPTILGAKKEKYSTNTYYVGTFEMGPKFNDDELKAFAAQRDSVKKLINDMNTAYGERRDPVVVNPPEDELPASAVVIPDTIDDAKDADVPF